MYFMINPDMMISSLPTNEALMSITLVPVIFELLPQAPHETPHLGGADLPCTAAADLTRYGQASETYLLAQLENNSN